MFHMNADCGTLPGPRRPLGPAALALLCGFTALASANDDVQARTRAILLSSPTWIVKWSPPDETNAYIAIVHIREERGALYAASAHPDGSPCYPDIRLRLQGDGFLFHGCTGVPKEMHFDPANPAAPFKGRAFGFRYQWSRAQ